MVRTSRYAAAAALEGQELTAGELVLHMCDLPLCVRSVAKEDIVAGIRGHIVLGTQRENMQRMALMDRGGGRRAIIARGAGVAARVDRARALREAIRDGWDAEAVQAALLGDSEQCRLW